MRIIHEADPDSHRQPLNKYWDEGVEPILF